MDIYVDEKEEKYTQFPIDNFFLNDGKFSYDGYFGHKSCWIKFNEDGMGSKNIQYAYDVTEPCKKIGVVAKFVEAQPAEV